MESEVDAYFAQHDVPTVISDLLYELGSSKPKDIGAFMASYIDRRYRLNGAVAKSSGFELGLIDSQTFDESFVSIEVRTNATSISADTALACSLLEELRALRQKYRLFHAQEVVGEGSSSSAEDATTLAIVPWTEFKADYERMLNILASAPVWSFCERRLAALRGLFEAHSALNAAAEETEAFATVGPRVDNCIQLARSLPPSRLLDLFRRLLAGELEMTAGPDNELLETLRGHVAELGRLPGPVDLTIDADSPDSSSSGLQRLFSRPAGLSRGHLLAEMVRSSFGLLEKTSAATGGETYAEYRLPLYGQPGAWSDLAQWASDFSVAGPRAAFVVQLPQFAYSALKEQRFVKSFKDLLENTFGPLAALVRHTSAEAQTHELAALLKSVVAFEVAALPAAGANTGESLGLEVATEPQQWTGHNSPPLAFQLYQVWARLKGLATLSNGQALPSFGFRAAVNTAESIACAYLLGADGISRAGALAAHAPLQYLFAVDAVAVSVSVCSQRSLGVAGNAGLKAFSELFKAGVPVTLCTEDPSISHAADDALGQEYAVAQTVLGLSQVDLQEIARNSVAISSFSALRRPEAPGKGRPTPIRDRYRQGRREAELSFVSQVATQSGLT